jgi:1-deoxy-D-xylulose-5-phosphate synthase
VTEALMDAEVLVPTLRLGVPDILVEHATPEQSFVSLELTPAQMAQRVLQRFAARSAVGV